MIAATIHVIFAFPLFGLLDRAQADRQCFRAMAEEQSQISDLSFEQALRELEGVVRRLESGDVPLEESIRIYERGSALKTHCLGKLKKAQLRVEQIVLNQDGEASTSPVDMDG